MEIPDWGIVGWVGAIIYIALIVSGMVIAVLGCPLLSLINQGNYLGLSLIGIGIAFAALGWNFLVTQFNTYRADKLAKTILEIKEQLNRIENK
jgi:hypothetical protein